MPSTEFKQTQREYVEASDGIVFVARRGADEKRCFIARRTLLTYFGALERAPDKRADSLRAFDQAAAYIRAVATRLIGKGRRSDSEPLVVTPHEVFRSVLGMRAKPAAHARTRSADVR